MKRHSSSRVSGFTLVELLVAIGLMMILVTVMAQIFAGAQGVTSTSLARTDLFGNARQSFEIMARDLSGILPKQGGNQRFWLSNQNSNPGNGHGERNFDGTSQSPGRGARDRVAANTVTCERGMPPRGLVVKYCLSEDLDPTLGEQGVYQTTRTHRVIHTLRRMIWELRNPPLPSELNNDLDRLNDPPARPIIADLCHYVLSMNIEVLYDPNSADQTAPRYYQLTDNTPYRAGSNLTTLPYPLGDGNPSTEPTLPPAIRITLRIVESAKEIQERVVSRVIWIP